MLEDKRKDQLVIIAQKIVDLLAKENDLPKIPVKFVELFDNKFAGAFFDPDKYEIQITYNTPNDAIIHEFIHYVIALFSVMERAEENLVKRATDGYVEEIKNEHQRSKQKKEMKDLILEFADITDSFTQKEEPEK